MKDILRAEWGAGSMALCRPSGEGPLIVQNAAPGMRPFIHSWRSPGGEASLTENVPPHHPWQHGLYTRLNGVLALTLNGLRRIPQGCLVVPHARKGR